MEKTIKNMELALTKAEEEFKKKNFHAVKTLMNTYSILLKQLKDTVGFIAKELPLKDNLEKQSSRLFELHRKATESIHTELSNGNYKNADAVTLSTDRLQKSGFDLKQILGAPKRFKAMSQHRHKKN